MTSRRNPLDSAAAVEAILAPLADRQRVLAEACRAFVRKVIPTMTERAYPGWKAIGFREPHAGYVAGLFPVADGIDLVFEHGRVLDDPEGLFADRPTMRQVRVVEIRKKSQLARPALAALLRRAVLHGSVRRRR